MGLLERKASCCVVRADKSWVEAEELTDSSCMQRWVASAGFTLLAFACLQLAWCSCQAVIDEYHHLKCKRKRLCEGRHDELPPAGAHRDTHGASSSLSCFSPFSFSSFLLHCSPCLSLRPSLLFCTFFDSPPFFWLLSTSLVFFSFSLFLLLFSFGTLFLSLYCPHDFHICPPSFIQLYLTHFCVSLFCLCCTFTLFSHLSCPLYVYLRRGSQGLSLHCPFCLWYLSNHMKRQNSHGPRQVIYLVLLACCIPPPPPWQWHISYAVFCNVISLNLPPC